MNENFGGSRKIKNFSRFEKSAAIISPCFVALRMKSRRVENYRSPVSHRFRPVCIVAIFSVPCNYVQPTHALNPGNGYLMYYDRLELVHKGRVFSFSSIEPARLAYIPSRSQTYEERQTPL